MAYIETHQSLRDHKKILQLAAELDMPEPHVTGHCVYLWLWSIDNAPDGLLPSVRIIERAAAWTGESGEFVEAMLAVGMLERNEDDQLVIHDWYGAHPSRRERNVVRRAWESMAKRIRPIVFQRDSYTCQMCGARGVQLEVDHVVPIALGGTNDLDNLQASCVPCNRGKGAT